MGEVYKARDPRLRRDVAIKVLPATLSADTERLQRFEQEARAAAALNHPNILAVYDLGQHDGAPYIVSELLEGDTLRDRLNGGALPVRKAVEYAIQMCHGLATAHDKGIVHRDLKPENIFITSDGRVKILDFGLAKLTEAAPSLSSVTALPTTPPIHIAPQTLAGVVLGTVGYMAPEQVRGLPADHRADIFAFGVVLYEMLAGRRAFHGDTAMDTMMAIAKEAASELPVQERQIPPALVRVVDRCMQKSPAARFQSTRDLAFALESLTTGNVPPIPASRTSFGRYQTVTVIVAIALIAVVATLAVVRLFGVRRTAVDAPAYLSSILPPAGVLLPTSVIPRGRFELSPDGRKLAFIGVDAEGTSRLWVQSLDSSKAKSFAGTEGGNGPFWSPDSRVIGFRAAGKIKKIDVNGGPPVALADTNGQPGATWSANDTILFATLGSGNPLRQVSGAGGSASPATALDSSIGENYHAYPFFLPDGRHFLYLAVGSKSSSPASPSGIYAGTLGSNERTLVVPGGSSPAYANGFLLFVRGQTLLAQPFDAVRLRLTGEPFVLAEGIATGGASGVAAGFSVSQTGVLAYQLGPAETGGNVGPLTQLYWVDRNGNMIGTIGEQTRSADIELSQDGSRLLTSVFDTNRRTRDIWLIDVQRGTRTRFTFDPSDAQSSVWTADGSRIAYNAARKGHLDLYEKASSGAGAETELWADAFDKYPAGYSPDGRFLLYTTSTSASAYDVWVLPLFGDRKPFPFLDTPFNEDVVRFSPDGRWVAYDSNESGRPEVYVTPFPKGAGKWQLSTAGGTAPRWRADGRELFYLAPDGKLMAVFVDGTSPAFHVGDVRPLFQTRLGGPRWTYDVAGNGQRFLVNTLRDESAAAPLTLVVNWPALTRKQ